LKSIPILDRGLKLRHIQRKVTLQMIWERNNLYEGTVWSQFI
jgi:hypothetical protein